MPKKIKGTPSDADTRSLRERMRGRTADLDAAIDGQVQGVPSQQDAKVFEDALPRLKGNQTTDKNNSGYF